MRYLIIFMLVCSGVCAEEYIIADQEGDTYYVQDGGTDTILVQDQQGNTETFLDISNHPDE